MVNISFYGRPIVLIDENPGMNLMNVISIHTSVFTLSIFNIRSRLLL